MTDIFPLRMTDIFLWSFCDSEADEGCYCCAANRQVAVPSNNVSMQRRDANLWTILFIPYLLDALTCEGVHR
jgi:hypothetical protein